jgi:hypothetical protein
MRDSDDDWDVVAEVDRIDGVDGSGEVKSILEGGILIVVMIQVDGCNN